MNILTPAQVASQSNTALHIQVNNKPISRFDVVSPIATAFKEDDWLLGLYYTDKPNVEEELLNIILFKKPDSTTVNLNLIADVCAQYNVQAKVMYRHSPISEELTDGEGMDVLFTLPHAKPFIEIEDIFAKLERSSAQHNEHPLVMCLRPYIVNNLPSYQVICNDKLSLQELGVREGLGLWLAKHKQGIWVYGNSGKELKAKLEKTFEFPAAEDVTHIATNIKQYEDSVIAYFIYRYLYKSVSLAQLKALFSYENKAHMADLRDYYLQTPQPSKTNLEVFILQRDLPRGNKYNEQL